ncbi:MAG: Glutamine-scyllo-inositol transaminase [candidate division TM6 bacterium GW2011_GWF2_37_49]|nr:MAG: Glutamine-scyllo-inositol transaminase [candidate division TM6 bacterium GW2011_GWF2_37_49]
MKTYAYGKQSISFGDIWEVVKVLRSPLLTQGPKVKEFEDALCAYTGAKYCVVVANGAAALHLAMLSLELYPGDQAITTPITFAATANSVLYAGGVVKFADVQTDTANIDPIEIVKNITDKTKVLVPVHFAGQSCDMQKIREIADKHNLFVVEDAAQAIGSEYNGHKVGSCKYSDLAIFSFHAVKTVTTGEGGSITTNNKNLYEKLLMLRTHGITRNVNYFTRDEGPWYCEQHVLGFNYRLTDFACALGISQLKRLEGFTKRRREIVEFYKNAFSDDERFGYLTEMPYSKACFHLFPLLINFKKIKSDKKEIFEKLKQKNIHVQVHHIPVYWHPYYQKLGFNHGDCPVAENYYRSAVSLPLYPGLMDADLRYIVDTVKQFC